MELPNVSFAIDTEKVYYNQSQPTRKEFKFMVDEDELTALEDMTWREWIYSDYNIHGYLIYRDYLYASYLIGGNGLWGSESWKAIMFDGYQLASDDFIQQTGYYLDVDGIGVWQDTWNLPHFILNDNEYTYNEGQSWLDYINDGAEGFSTDGDNVIYNGAPLLTPLNTNVKSYHKIIKFTTYLI
jgi:hypothetical protein